MEQRDRHPLRILYFQVSMPDFVLLEFWKLFFIREHLARRVLRHIFSDICDCEFDKDVERCKVRPLPSGMISYGEAVAAFIGWIPIMLGTTYYTLGTPGMVTFIPVWAFSLIYPSMKRVIPFPQVILGVTIGAAVFPGWVAVTNSLEGLEEGLPLFAATMTWVIYFDVFYATQDHQDDRKIGVKSLAVLLGDQTWIFLAFLGFLQVMFFAVTALKANMSYIWWVFGLGVWALNIPWHVLSLDMDDPRSGAKIFKANIMLGLYMTGIALVELLIMRVYIRALLHIAEHAIDVDSMSYKNLVG